MPPVMQELKTTSLRESVADAIRRTLLEGQIPHGERISDSEIASQLKVSRGIVREALLVLSQEGLVNHSRNQGFSVLEVTEQDQRQIEQVRLSMEGLALNLARERVSAQDLELLEKLKEEVVAAFNPGDFRNLVHRDLEFHATLWEQSGNPWLVQALKRIMVPYFAYAMAFKMRQPDLTEELLRRRHDIYLDYLKGQCQKSAEDCVRFHIGIITP